MNNITAIQNKMELFLATKVHNDILRVLENVAESIVLFMESGVIPVDTGNLQDSTGIGIYHGDVLVRYIPNKSATEARANGKNRPLYNPNLPTKNVWGIDELKKAINYGAMKFSTGYCLVVFSAMPYAGTQNQLKGYFDKITENLKPLIVTILMQAK